MLSNAYFPAKFRFDTAENEPAKNLQNFVKFANFADPNPLTLTLKPQADLTETGQRRRFVAGRRVVAAHGEEEDKGRARRGHRVAAAGTAINRVGHTSE